MGHAAFVAVAYNGIGYSLHHRGRYAEGEKPYRDAMPWYDRAFGKRSSSYAVLLSNLGELLRKLGRLDDAAPFVMQSVEIITPIAQDNPDAHILILNNSATYQMSRGQTAEAGRLFELAMSIAEPRLGKDHPTVGAILGNIGVVYQSQGNCGKALPALQRAAEIDANVYGPEHPLALDRLRDVATALECMGQQETAAQLRARIEEAAKRGATPSK